MEMKRNSGNDRSGMTVTELTAILAVLGLFAALLPAAVQQTREQARLKGCQDRLHKFGLALHNYCDTYSCYPMGWMEPEEQSLLARLEGDSKGGWGFQARLLPYLGQLEWFNRLDVTTALPGPANGPKGLMKTMGVFRCPADRMEIANPLRGGYMTSNYSGCCGNQAISAWGPGELTGVWPGSGTIPEKVNGVFWWNTSTHRGDFMKGSANTFLMGERSVTSAAGIWPGVRSNRNFTDQVTDCSPGNEINSGIAAFSSLHAGGANFLMGSGAVQFVNEEIESGKQSTGEPGLYQRLASLTGGE